MRRESSRDTQYYLQGICPGPYRLPGRGQPALRASADLHPPRPDPLHIHHLPLSGPGPTGRRIHLPRQEVYVHTVCSENVRVCIKYINILERINYEKCKKKLPPFSGVVRPPESVVRKVNCKKML